MGMSDHHRAYAGTISITPLTYTQLLVEMVESIIRWPASRICILNGHGGNITSGRQAIAVLMSRGHYDVQITFATYWELAGKAWLGDPPMEAPSVSHACEYETSAMLHVKPDAVDVSRYRLRRRTHPNPYIGWEDDQPYLGVSMIAPTEQITDNGVMGGDPRKATKAKGKHLVEKAVDGLVKFVDSFAEWPPMKDTRKR
jgi:creatinine amidohydrolase